MLELISYHGVRDVTRNIRKCSVASWRRNFLAVVLLFFEEYPKNRTFGKSRIFFSLRVAKLNVVGFNVILVSTPIFAT
jgi:hypothetical protein